MSIIINSKHTSHRFKHKRIRSLLGACVLVVLVINAAMGYVHTEIRTNLFAEDFAGVEELCVLRTDAVFEEIKIIYFSRAQRKATVYCLFDNSSQNMELVLNRRSDDAEWEAVLTTKLNKKQNLYWPVY